MCRYLWRISRAKTARLRLASFGQRLFFRRIFLTRVRGRRLATIRGYNARWIGREGTAMFREDRNGTEQTEKADEHLRQQLTFAKENRDERTLAA